MTQPMRILHTSDWHLGQHFMGKTRQAEHQAFCAWLIEQVREQAVDGRADCRRYLRHRRAAELRPRAVQPLYRRTAWHRL